MAERIGNAKTRRRTMLAANAERHKQLWTRLRDALLNDFHENRRWSEQAQRRHHLSEDGDLLHKVLPEISSWARQGFDYKFFAGVVMYSRRGFQAARSPVDDELGFQTYRCFLDLALFHGERIARGAVDDERRLVHDRFEGRPDYLYVMLGGPMATVELVEMIFRLIDLLYLGVHGDYAVHIAEWTLEIQLNHYVSGLRTLFGHGNDEAKALADALWLFAAGDALRQQLNSFKREIALWIDKKPVAKSAPEWPLPQEGIKRGSIGFTVNDFLLPRLQILAKICGNNEREANPRVSTMTIQGRDSKKTVQVWLNAAAYPRGGRKPPSVTHGTTYGADLDLKIGNAPKSESEAIGRAEASLALAITKIASQLGIDWTQLGPSLYGNGTDDFLYAVAFTQAIILTLPSRFYFGDHVVIAAAWGGIVDKLKEIRNSKSGLERIDNSTSTEQEELSAEGRDTEQQGTRITWEELKELEEIGEFGKSRINLEINEKDIPKIRTVLDYEPVGHFNHWHVDWLDSEFYSKIVPVPDLCYFDPKAVRPLKGERNPLPSRKRMARPVYIGNPKIPAGSKDEITKLYKFLTLDGKQPLELPIGDVENPEKLIEWLEKYLKGKIK